MLGGSWSRGIHHTSGYIGAGSVYIHLQNDSIGNIQCRERGPCVFITGSQSTRVTYSDGRIFCKDHVFFFVLLFVSQKNDIQWDHQNKQTRVLKARVHHLALVIT